MRVLAGREVPLGGERALTVRRTLPHRERRTIGAWCFLDGYGPAPARMHVPPHPHTGLQTVSWLFSGDVLHRDSIGSEQPIAPGELNIMTSGRGIAHSEHSVGDAQLQGLQLWAALPDFDRFQEPHFEHHGDLPRVDRDGFDAIVVVGGFAGVESPAVTYTRLLGVELTVRSSCRVGLRDDFEHGLLAVDPVTVDDQRLEAGEMAYLPPGTTSARVAGDGLCFLIGGAPFTEPLVMWWNFVGRDHDEIVADRIDWQAGARFGVVPGGEPALPAPPMPTTRLSPR